MDRGQVDGDRVRGFLAAILEDEDLLPVRSTYVQLAQTQILELDEFPCLLPVPTRVSSRFRNKSVEDYEPRSGFSKYNRCYY